MMNNSFSDYLKSSRELFKQLFGEDQLKNIDNIKPKSTVDTSKILDVTTPQITATFTNVKDRFSDEDIQYWIDRGESVFDLFLTTVFHYGYQQAIDHNKCDLETKKLVDLFIKQLSKKENE